MTGRKRCRYQVWERGRGMSNYQCNHAAIDERPLTIRAHRIDGRLIPARTATLPVCGTHRNAVDRNPRSGVHSAYTWSESDGRYKSRETEFVR